MSENAMQSEIEKIMADIEALQEQMNEASQKPDLKVVPDAPLDDLNALANSSEVDPIQNQFSEIDDEIPSDLIEAVSRANDEIEGSTFSDVTKDELALVNQVSLDDFEFNFDSMDESTPSEISDSSDSLSVEEPIKPTPKSDTQGDSNRSHEPILKPEGKPSLRVVDFGVETHSDSSTQAPTSNPNLKTKGSSNSNSEPSFTSNLSNVWESKANSNSSLSLSVPDGLSLHIVFSQSSLKIEQEQNAFLVYLPNGTQIRVPK